MFTKLIEGMLLVVAIAMGARLVWEFIGGLVPGLIALLVVSAIVLSVLRGPRPGNGLFHK